MRSITSRATLARGAGLDEMTLDGLSGQSLVPKKNGHGDAPAEVASESARRLRPGPLRPVEVDGKAEHDGADAVFGDCRRDGLGIVRELGPLQRAVGCCDRARHVRQRHADGLGAEVEAKKPRLGAEPPGQVFDRDERCYTHERQF